MEDNVYFWIINVLIVFVLMLHSLMKMRVVVKVFYQIVP